MRIGMDVRYLSHGLVGGIHTFQKNLVWALNGLQSEHQFVLYVDDKRRADLPDPLAKHMAVRTLPYRGPISSVQHDMRMQRAMEPDRLDIYYFAGNYGFGPKGRTVVTLQDEINIMPLPSILRGHNKAPRTVAMMTYLHYFTTTALRRADRVVTISDYSRQQILRYSGLDASRVAVIPHGCPVDMQRIEDAGVIAEVRSRLGIQRPYFLAEAFKNPDVIVRAWEALPEEVRASYQIVFFSRSADVRPSVHAAVERGWAQLFVRPARQDLAALFSGALAFVFPSWIEGFGIPLVEAMTCGAPMITSNRAAIPEIVGEAALLIDADDDEALKCNLLRLVQSPGERERLRELGLVRSTKFTWKRAAEQYAGLFEQMAQVATTTMTGVR